MIKKYSFSSAPLIDMFFVTMSFIFRLKSSIISSFLFNNKQQYTNMITNLYRKDHGGRSINLEKVVYIIS